MSWNSVQVRENYNTVSQSRVLQGILTEKYGLAPEDFFVPGRGERENPYGNYVFIRSDDFHALWERLRYERMIDDESGHLEIPDDQMQALLDESFSEENAVEEEAALYDIVQIERTVYSNLYGIVLDVMDERYVVGFNFFAGPRTCEFERKAFKKVKGLFTIWKFPVH